MARHQLTKDERKKGFRNAVFNVQVKHGLEFNQAVCWLKNKIGWQSPAERRRKSAG